MVKPPVEQEPEETGGFPVVLEGHVGGQEVIVPFISTADSESYISMLQWAIERYKLIVEVKVFAYGKHVATIKSPDYLSTLQ